MKYIDADKLLAEIERLSSSEHPVEYYLAEKLAYNRALSEIKDSITSLQQEQQSEYVCRDVVVDAIKLAYGEVSMNPFDCSDVFEKLLNKFAYEIH